MDYIAARGYDVYLLDIRGYGKSTRPKEMAEPPEAIRPIVRGETAVKDIGAVVDFILARRNIARLNLLGWSWGTTLMATYTTQNAHKGRAAGALRAGLDSADRIAGAGWARAARRLPHGRTRTGAGALDDRRARGQEGGLIPAGWFDAWADATFASDPDGAKMNPPVLRAPNGVVQDGQRVLRCRQALLRPGEDHGADAAGPRRMGPRHAALYGADAVPAAGQRARQALSSRWPKARIRS